jgi:hypothetical protein
MREDAGRRAANCGLKPLEITLLHRFDGMSEDELGRQPPDRLAEFRRLAIRFAEAVSAVGAASPAGVGGRRQEGGAAW